MMAWTLMNVNNATPWLWMTNPLSNIDQVVIEGNPTDGWTLVSWGGIAQDEIPSLLTQLFVNTRDLIVEPQMASYYVQEAMVQSLQAQDPAIWLAALENGFNDVTQAMLNYPGAMVESMMSYINGDIELGWDEWAQGLQVMGGFTMTLAEGVLNSLIPEI